MSFPTNNTLLDDFNRANASLTGGVWGTTDFVGSINTLDVISNQVGKVSGTFCSSYTATDYGPDCECRWTVAALPADGGSWITGLRMQNAGNGNYSFYYLTIQRSGTAYNWTGGHIDGFTSTATPVVTPTAQTITVGSKIGFQAIGTTISGWHQPSGSSTWTQVVSGTTSLINVAGRMALQNGDNLMRIDDFTGGTAGPTGIDYIKTGLGIVGP